MRACLSSKLGYSTLKEQNIVNESSKISMLNVHAVTRSTICFRLQLELIDQVSILQRRAERRDGKFKKIMKNRHILVFIR